MNSIVQYIIDNYRGATITVFTTVGYSVTGDVIEGFDNVLALRMAGITVFINGTEIVGFM